MKILFLSVLLIIMCHFAKSQSGIAVQTETSIGYITKGKLYSCNDKLCIEPCDSFCVEFNPAIKFGNIKIFAGGVSSIIISTGNPVEIQPFALPSFCWPSQIKWFPSPAQIKWFPSPDFNKLTLTAPYSFSITNNGYR